LKITPNDKEAIQQLASLDFEYIPMRFGPMIIEEIEEDENSLKPKTHPLHLKQVARNDSFSDSNDITKNIDSIKKTSSSQGFDVNDNRNVHQINHSDHKFDDLIENNESKILPSTLPIQESNCMQIRQNVSKNNSQIQHVVDSNESNIKNKPPKAIESININESNSNNSISKNAYEDKLEHQAKEEKEKGNICFKKKQYTLAIECYTESLKYVPTNAIVLANRALCFINVSNINEIKINNYCWIRL